MSGEQYGGCSVPEARNLASRDAAVVSTRRSAPGLPEAGEIPMLVNTLRDTLGRLDREFGMLKDKMTPVLAPEYPAADGSNPRMKAESSVGDDLAGLIYHTEMLANAVVDLRARAKL